MIVLGMICGAAIGMFCMWAYMDHLQDQRWNREHGIVDDHADDLIRKAVTGELFDGRAQDEHMVTLKVLWTGNSADGLEMIEQGGDALMTFMQSRTTITDPSIEQTNDVR